MRENYGNNCRTPVISGSESPIEAQKKRFNGPLKQASIGPVSESSGKTRNPGRPGTPKLGTKLLLLIIIFLAAAAFAQNLTGAVTQPATTGLEILSNWRTLAVLAIFISVILVAIAYMIGIGFEMPGMEAWARSELTQVFANVIIIIMLIVTVAFIDFATLTMVNNSGLPENCIPSENCLNKTANVYLADYIDAAKDGARNTLENNIEAAGWANRRAGIFCTTVYCGQAGLTSTIVGNYVLDVDRYSLIFEYYTGLLSSLNAQKFFINEICFKVGPLLLALGIVARAFFFSRKTGGLLIAMAAGIMFFFPMMYVFNWMSLDMTLTGDDAVQDQPSFCPEECGYGPPIAYYFNTSQGKNVGLDSPIEVYKVFSQNDRNKAKEIILGNKTSYPGIGGITVYTCVINSSKPGFSQYKVAGGNDTCDRSCRELPYPSGSSLCAATAMQLACSALPEPCKVKRIVVKKNDTLSDQCPKECKLVPPLKSDCNVKSDGTTAGGDCLKSRFDCRVAKIDDLTWRPSIDSGAKGAEKCNTYPKDCVANLDANKSCVWVMPEFGACEDLCKGCPEECRFLNESDVKSPKVSSCFNNETDEYLDSCKSCPDTCKVNISRIQALNPPAPNCTNCPLNHRILPAVEVLPTNYTSGNCSLTFCSAEFRVSLPRSACEECIFTEESYMYTPPINSNCGEICKPPDNAPSKSPGDYSKIGEEGLVGREEIKSVSKLMIPGYLLPLFNIAATIIVIRALSGMLGGDIEIPGLAKIF